MPCFNYLSHTGAQFRMLSNFSVKAQRPILSCAKPLKYMEIRGAAFPTQSRSAGKFDSSVHERHG